MKAPLTEDVLAEIRMPDWHDKPSYVHGWDTAMAAVRAALVGTGAISTERAFGQDAR